MNVMAGSDIGYGWAVDHFVFLIDDGVASEDEKKDGETEKKTINKGF